MEVLIAVAAAGVLALSASAFGADSETWSDTDRRPWWPGRRP
jgi:hypothetical protein